MTVANAVESLFFTAVAKPPGERAAVRAGACEPDALRWRRVDRLLPVHPQMDGFPERPAAVLSTVELPSTGEPQPADPPGLVLASKYKLIERIGEGGMGTVWLAQQTE